jgi:uncharacterized protein (TIGR02453 family)
MNPRFTQKTFQYFDLAHKNKNNAKWFEKNRSLYEDHVKAPMAHLVTRIRQEYQTELPRISLDPSAVTRPLRPKNRAAQGGGLVKNFSHFTLWEKKTSLFEWNPGIHFQVGHKTDDNFLGLGLYMVSSRQLSLLRVATVEDFEEIDSFLEDKKLKKIWGGPLGDRYKRFPKGFNPEDPRTKYLWYKQFYLGKNFSRKEVISPKFIEKNVSDLELALPFFNWVRAKVGTYLK